MVTLIERVVACLLAVGCAAVTIDTPRPPVLTPPHTRPITIPISTSTATVAPTPTATPPSHPADASAILLRMEDHSDCTTRSCFPPLVIFALYGDGRAVYRTSLTEASADVRIVQLDEPAIDELLAFSIENGGLSEIESYSAFDSIPHVTFEVRSAKLTKSGAVGQGLSQLLESQMASYQPFERLARRLVNFGTAVGDRSRALSACAVSPLGTIPPNDVVAWASSIWQHVVADVWAAPLAAFGDGADYADPVMVGFPSSISEFKVLWWVPEGHGHPLAVHITRVPDGVGADLAVDLVLAADTAFPNRPDRPSGIPSLPPGCYEFTVTIGSDTGSLIEQVRL